MSKQKVFIYYHGGGCYDGFTAGWVAHRWYKRFSSLTQIECIPAVYQTPLPRAEELLGPERDIAVFVDYSRPRAELQALVDRGIFVIVLDHHETAQKDLVGFKPPIEDGRVVFDMKRSGAGIAWDYFFGDRRRPLAIDYVEDRDLWAFKYPSTPFFHAYLTSLPQTFEQWDIAMSDDNISRALTEGGAIERTIRQYAEKSLAFVRANDGLQTLLGKRVVTVNLPPMNVSETLHAVLDAHPYADVAISWQVRPGSKMSVSLRSRRGGPHVGEMAKHFGGGGHPNAAGFEVPTDSPIARCILSQVDFA